MAWFFGGWIAMETVMAHSYFCKMAKGWKLCSIFGLAFLNKNLFNFMSAPMYQPAIGALLRKN